MYLPYPEWKEIRDSLLVVRLMRSRANFPLIQADMPTFMGQRYATSPEDLKGVDVAIIGSNSTGNESAL